MAESLAFEVSLRCDHDEAISRVTEALKSEGFGILTRIDVKATLKEKLGAEFRPYVILGACNPPFAHRVLSHEPRAGLLLPCNVTVEADPDGGSIVRIADPAVLLDTGGLGKDELLREVAGQIRVLLEQVAGRLGAGA
ncbi:MAG TPA: DUF302 domain-containing protein [Candidatus Saccharimonadales bacterium]|nr:DUF302 domain-containing protein [Candidatus Saccharimonadales bacterium]